MDLGFERKSPSLGWFVLAAVLFHAVVVQTQWLKKVMQSESSPLANVFPPIVVEPWAGKERREVVQTSKALEDQTGNERADRVGEVRNRVRTETQATRRGKFQEGGAGRTNPEAQLEGDGSLPPSTGAGMAELMPGASPNVLKGVREGGQTLLNTDKVLYASFINRIADEIYDVWVNHCEEGVKDIYRRGAKLGPNLFVTKLSVVMTNQGEVSSLQIVKSSGIRELDDAPKKAFWEAGPFPNPPRQLIDSDGFLRLVYEFQFEWRTSGFSIVPQV